MQPQVFLQNLLEFKGMTINADHTIKFTISEHQDSFYTFGTQQEVATIPDTTLPNPFSVQPPASITLVMN